MQTEHTHGSDPKKYSRVAMDTFPWEDGLLERKIESDLKDVLKTMVAFANSVRPGHVATLLIGEKDDGTVQGVTNPDNIQKRVRDEAEKIYPDIIWRQSIYEREGKYCVRVEIEYSGETPHFGGPAWVRRGSESVKATDEIFQTLIDIRTGMVRELAKWIDKEVSIEREGYDKGGWFLPMHGTPIGTATMREVNRFYATFEFNGKRYSEPLKKLTLTWDDDRSRLKVLIEFCSVAPVPLRAKLGV